jgi:hypothetical protein
MEAAGKAAIVPLFCEGRQHVGKANGASKMISSCQCVVCVCDIKYLQIYITSWQQAINSIA